MVRQLRAALVAFVLLTVITGVLYPLLITGVGQVLFPVQANGSLVERDGSVVGSSLIGQTTDDASYFWWRPSAVNAMVGSMPDALIASGGSNAGWTNASLADSVQQRADAFRQANNLPAEADVPEDMLFASASGLDPHISPEAAALQIDRVANVRGISRELVESLVLQNTERPQFGILGQPRVNVLLLNLALDELDQSQ
jgi:K+-transporting ATPase ATPase C chain